MKSTPPDLNSTSPAPSAGEVSIIEADAGVGELLVELLQNQFQVKSFSSLKDFEKAFLSKEKVISPDLILCDAKLRDATGIDALKRVRGRNPTIPFILMVTAPDKKWTEDAFQAGVTDLLEKPFESFLFIDKFCGRIAQARAREAEGQLKVLLVQQLLLTTTKVNRLYNQIAMATETPTKRLHYAIADEDQVRFEHARKSEEKLSLEIEQCRIEYLKLAKQLGVS